MKALVDTHALLWWLFDDRRLSARAREVLEDGASCTSEPGEGPAHHRRQSLREPLGVDALVVATLVPRDGDRIEGIDE